MGFERTNATDAACNLKARTNPRPTARAQRKKPASDAEHKGNAARPPTHGREGRVSLLRTPTGTRPSEHQAAGPITRRRVLREDRQGVRSDRPANPVLLGMPAVEIGRRDPGRSAARVTSATVGRAQGRLRPNAGVQRPGCRALRGAGALQVEHSQGEPGSSRVRCNALLGAESR